VGETVAISIKPKLRQPSVMALTILLDPETEMRLFEAAVAQGLSPEILAAQTVAAYWDEHGWDDDGWDDDGWEEDDRRMNEPGANIALDVSFDELAARVAAKRAGQ
jgi:predicted transcriptional regulator